jgi:hypothetical protein
MENRDLEQENRVPDYIALLWKEPKIREKIRSHLKPEARSYTKWEFDERLNRIYIGKHSWGGFGGFWNRLIKCCDHITLDDFFIQVWDALVEMTAGMPAHEAVLEGLSREVLIEGIRKKDTAILRRFMDVCEHLTKDGYWSDPKQRVNKRLQGEDSHQVNYKCPYADRDGVEVVVEPRRKPRKETLRVVDSVGDTFEVIDVHWVGR